MRFAVGGGRRVGSTGGEECDEWGRGDIEVVLVRRASAKEPGRHTVEAEVLVHKELRSFDIAMIKLSIKYTRLHFYLAHQRQTSDNHKPVFLRRGYIAASKKQTPDPNNRSKITFSPKDSTR